VAKQGKDKMKRGRMPAPKVVSPSAQTAEQPAIRWEIVGTVIAARVILWITALGVQSYTQGGVVGWVAIGVMAAVTLGVAGFGIYVWRLTRRSQGLAQILSQATDEEGRKRALEQLEAEESKDAMNALARSQLLVREDPKEAMRILEEVEVEKAPGVVQDDVRANLGFLYLLHNRPKDARPLADAIKFDRQPNAKAKAMYAAVVVETFARTGKREESLKLLETYDATDPEYGEVRAMLLRAQVYAYNANKKSGMAKKAMRALAAEDPNQLAQFLQKGTRPDLKKMATQVLNKMGLAPRPQMRMQRR
jgi:hypothetical protein